MVATPDSLVAGARLSMIVLTDEYATIHRVVQMLCAQTIAKDVELVVGCPDAKQFALPADAHRALARIVVVECPLLPLGAARAATVRAATAPVVALGETHAFPARDWAEQLLRAHEGPAQAVAPGMENGNPETARSWCGFLMDYGRWLAEDQRGSINEPPTYNATWKRVVLLALGDRLPLMLEPGGSVNREVTGQGARFYHEPAARVAHLNVVTTWGAWVAERYWGGRLFGARRSRGWPQSRRIVYFGGSVLVPLIRFVRTRDAVTLAGRRRRLPSGTLAAVALGCLVWGVGEAMGYVAGEGRAEARMMEYELHKERYV